VKFSVTNRSNAAVRYEYRGRPMSLAAKQARTHESCAGGELKVGEKPGAAASVRPKNGGRYVIVEAGGGAYRVSEE
jgi:hypothetical protein